LPRYSVIAADTLRDLVTFDLLTLVSGHTWRVTWSTPPRSLKIVRLSVLELRVSLNDIQHSCQRKLFLLSNMTLALEIGIQEAMFLYQKFGGEDERWGQDTGWINALSFLQCFDIVCWVTETTYAAYLQIVLFWNKWRKKNKAEPANSGSSEIWPLKQT